MSQSERSRNVFGLTNAGVNLLVKLPIIVTILVVSLWLSEVHYQLLVQYYFPH